MLEQGSAGLRYRGEEPSRLYEPLSKLLQILCVLDPPNDNHAEPAGPAELRDKRFGLSTLCQQYYNSKKNIGCQIWGAEKDGSPESHPPRLIAIP